MKLLAAVLLIPLAFLFTPAAHALDPIPHESGFSGFVRAGAGMLNYRSNLVAGNSILDIGEETIDSLTDEPESQTAGLGIFNFSLNYTFASTRTQLSLGSQIEDIARLQQGTQLAVKQELPDKSIISAAFLFSSLPTKVWKDPYVTGDAREETDRSSSGVRLVYDRILGSDFEIRYSFRSIEIDDEESGSDLGLPTSQRDLLRRDGQDHQMALNYRFDFMKNHRLVPSITYYTESRDGDAMSKSGADFQVTYFYFSKPFTLVLNGLIGQSENDEANPIYGKTQEDDRYGANVQVYFKNPFGWKPFGHEDFSLFASGTYLQQDANIDFYDTEVSIIAVGVMVRFI